MNNLFNALRSRVRLCTRMISISVAVLLFTCLFSNLVNAQVDQFPTPNAAAVTMFDQYPQSDFTGVPDIGVPVYDLNYQGMSLPIILKYNNNSVRPNLPASWVGLGWNLSVGGMINRVVNGKPDDATWYEPFDYVETRDEQMGLYYNYNSLAGNWADATRIGHAMLDISYYTKWYSITGEVMPSPSAGRTIRDYSPDEFSFSVGKLSGVFYLDDLRQWKVRSKDKVKVLITEADFQSDYTSSVPEVRSIFDGSVIVPAQALPRHRYINRITLLDDQGIKYVFGGISSATEDVQHADVTYEKYIKTWHLTSVEFPNGKSIRLDYEPGPYIYTERPIGKFLAYNYNTNSWEGNGLIYSAQRSHPTYLTKIVTDDVEVDFFRSPQVNNYAQLNNIKVYTKKQFVSTGLLKDLYFSYSNSAHNILKLSSFFDKDPLTGEKHIYKFGYNPDAFYDVYKNTDSWGYYTSRPLDATSGTAFLNSRAADTLNCRMELLDRVTYPTGGHTQYTWEPNSYSQAVDHGNRQTLISYPSLQYAGGVRIIQINNYDTEDHRAGYKRYYYVKDFAPAAPNSVSSGIIYSTMAFSYGGAGNYTTDSAAPLVEDNVGSHITYSEVAVVNMDGGYRKTIYSNFDTGVNGEYKDEPAVLNATSGGSVSLLFTSNAHERGFPLQEIQYNKSGTPVAERIFTYNRINKATEFVKSYKGMVQPVNGFFTWKGSALKKYTNAYVVASETAIRHYAGGDESSSLTYTYDPATLYISSTTSSDSKGSALTTTFKYTGDMISTSQDPNGIYAGMLAANITSPVIETATFKSTSLVTRVKNNYFKTPFNLYQPLSVEIQNGQAQPEVKMNFPSYDAAGNLVSQNPPGGASTSYQWGYNGQYPVAKVSNAYTKYVNVIQNGVASKSVTLYLGPTANNYPNPTTATFQQNIAGNIIVGFSASVPSTTYSISFNYTLTGPSSRSGSYSCYNGTCNLPTGNNLTFANMPAGSYTLTLSGSTTFPSYTFQIGVSVSYQALLQSLLPENEFFYESFEESGDTGVTIDQAHTGRKSFSGSYTTSFTKPVARNYTLQWWSFDNIKWNLNEQQFLQNVTLNGKIDDIRIFPSDGQMSTYTYDQMIGPTSETDSKGQTIFYEYDGFLRLVNKKDNKRNIIQNYRYNTYRDPDPVVWNTVKSGFFTKYCATGVGSTVEYIVPANTYSAATLDAANALAQADVNGNGQAYANDHGTCQLIPFARLDLISTYQGPDNHTYGNYVFKLFSDEAGTIPYTAPASLTLNYRATTHTTVNGGSPSTSSNNSYVIVPSGASTKSLTLDINTCGQGGQAIVSGTPEPTMKGNMTTNVLPPGGGGNTTCISVSLMLLSGTGYALWGI
jgi:hypothetical protein